MGILTKPHAMLDSRLITILSFLGLDIQIYFQKLFLTTVRPFECRNARRHLSDAAIRG